MDGILRTERIHMGSIYGHFDTPNSHFSPPPWCKRFTYPLPLITPKVSNLVHYGKGGRREDCLAAGGGGKRPCVVSQYCLYGFPPPSRRIPSADNAQDSPRPRAVQSEDNLQSVSRTPEPLLGNEPSVLQYDSKTSAPWVLQSLSVVRCCRSFSKQVLQMAADLQSQD